MKTNTTKAFTIAKAAARIKNADHPGLDHVRHLPSSEPVQADGFTTIVTPHRSQRLRFFGFDVLRESREGSGR